MNRPCATETSALPSVDSSSPAEQIDLGVDSLSMFRYWLVLLVLLPFGMLLASGCGSSQPACTGGLHPYKNKCLSNTAIEYVGCTEGRGINTTREIGGGIKGTFKVVANASLDLAYKKSKQENTPVALQIVKDCMEIAKSSGSAAEQSIATAFQQQADQYQQEFEQRQVGRTPEITLSSNSAGGGEQITVTGIKFVPNEMVDISVGATLVKQVRADGDGGFTAAITIPSSGFSTGFDTQIIASGTSSARAARAPFRAAP